MNRSPRIYAVLMGGVLAAIGSPILAQQALYVVEGDSALLVRNVQDQTPLVEKDGKLVTVDSHRFTLQKIAEYDPVFISVLNFKANNPHRINRRDNKQTNQRFKFQGEFESNFSLKHVFLVIGLDTQDAGRKLFVQEIGDLDARVPRTISFLAPIDEALGRSKRQLHLFVDGREVLHSRLPSDYREQVLDRMVADRIKGVENAPLRPFVGPAPEYPQTLRKMKAEGSAVIDMRIAVDGRVQNPRVKSASDPAFGAAAAAALSTWRFVPQVKDGHPVEAEAEMPVLFPVYSSQVGYSIQDGS